MTILDKIVKHKHGEVSDAINKCSIEALQKKEAYSRKCNSLVEKLKEPTASGVIAEFKRQSPSKGDINSTANVSKVTQAYVRAGASALSVLTDQKFFGGNIDDLICAREANPSIPILRKDFVVHPYQIHEAKAYGADIILLIASCLSAKQIHEFAIEAKSLGLESILELHSIDEIDKISPEVSLIGINNRNLKTFEVDIDNSLRLKSMLPDSKPLIAESGLSDPEQVKRLKAEGFRAFLMGETFMKENNQYEACSEFIAKIS